jgi:hypothetical protein
MFKTPLTENIRLEWSWLTLTNTLAYLLNCGFIYCDNSFIVLAVEAKQPIDYSHYSVTLCYQLPYSAHFFTMENMMKFCLRTILGRYLRKGLRLTGKCPKNGCKIKERTILICALYLIKYGTLAKKGFIVLSPLSTFDDLLRMEQHILYTSN